MKLTCFTVGHGAPLIRPAPVLRDWMDETHQQFAYRCLPLNIANSSGWEILCAADFTATWDGGSSKEAIKVVTAGATHEAPLSHFGHGVLTFHVNALFQTEPGYNLYATGPVNSPKDGIQALTGIIETDWSPYTFTMNWIFTRANTMVSFKKGEPFCFFFPQPRNLIETVEPEIRALSAAPELHEAYTKWTSSRVEFNAALQQPGSAAQQEKWQKIYYVGNKPNGEAGAEDHRIKVRLREFREAGKK